MGPVSAEEILSTSDPTAGGESFAQPAAANARNGNTTTARLDHFFILSSAFQCLASNDI
jgi:hypothetical protein